MAERKSFVIYKDWEKVFSLLSDMQMGTLFRALFAYVNRDQPYEGDDQVVGIAFAFVRITLDRDNEKYKARCASNARNGKKGGRPRKSAEAAESLPERGEAAACPEGADEFAACSPEPAAPFERPEEPAAEQEYAQEWAYGTPSPNAAGGAGYTRARAAAPSANSAAGYTPEQAKRAAYLKAQREKWESYEPPRASPANAANWDRSWYY
ncbi:MAG: DUF6291 domain-containing protein [Clostridiales bacterium]|nr:DUF6291 domain-containing protein [Clostridiales bacterium]